MTKTTEAQLLVSHMMQELASAIDSQLKQVTGKDLGFCLVVFNEEDNSYCNYVANTDRQITKEALKHMIELWEKGMPDIPTHDRH